MPEATADILSKTGTKCEYRDTIFVKGKGLMRVYLSNTDTSYTSQTMTESVSEQAISDLYAT